ncbi:DUF6163 family protein [Ancylobacter polymorphus]|jgi:hypothetical protein|uniref:DUF6163 family protein n=1 Tax=Ancylobacter polymorphus TaxID=223390 RepID=A0A9E7D2V7_9HYPH|nr:DUF6163 family protein [Ancylobacter polymorphus]MDQ0301248.1 hypothetical protein [Ancylobacter polymorphus]MPT22387.1 hypothetical protein [Starkeya sp.]UOK70297.1 DUF6163 family protein [Ancylobacter polymorphus]
MSSPYDPIDATLGPAGARMPLWQSRVILYLRCLAGFLMVKTVYSWTLICGVWDGDMSRFEMISLAAKSAVIWAAIMNPVAAVGLWLGASWGVVLWLVTAMVQILINASAPEGVGRLMIVAALETILVAGYAFLTYKAARESER